MKYQLKQGIDREEMRAEIAGPCDQQDFEKIETIMKEFGEDFSPFKDLSTAYKFVFRKENKKWHMCPIDAWIVFNPTITLPEFIAKYFEPCTTK